MKDLRSHIIRCSWLLLTIYGLRSMLLIKLRGPFGMLNKHRWSWDENLILPYSFFGYSFWSKLSGLVINTEIRYPCKGKIITLRLSYLGIK